MWRAAAAVVPAIFQRQRRRLRNRSETRRVSRLPPESRRAAAPGAGALQRGPPPDPRRENVRPGEDQLNRKKELEGSC